MTRIFFHIVLMLSLAGCASSSHYYKKGNYDAAIGKAVKKLRKKPEKHKELDILREAYRIANQKDNERISYLKLEGSPEKWDEVFHIYTRLKNRQNLAGTIPSYARDAIGFKAVNYDAEIVEAKKKAAEYFYTHGTALLQSGNRDDARLAWHELNKVKRYYSNFRDVDEQLRKAKALGTSYVLFAIENKSQVIIPKAFDEELRRISLSELNDQWIEYHTSASGNITYDYHIQLKITLIDISPERVREVHYEESKEVKDGWEYKLDEKGNVAKDTAGNDIKVTKYTTIRCKIVESVQTKAAILAGSLNYIDKTTGQLILTEPISTETVFEHSAAIPLGDTRALKAETLEKTKRRPVPFPSDTDMITMASDVMKEKLKEIIWRNKGVLK